MNSTLNKAIMFAAGAAIGSVVTWKLVEKKYEQIAQEEIDSVKETYSEIYENRRELDKINKEKKEEHDRKVEEKIQANNRKEYHKAMKDSEYNTVTEENNEEKEEKNGMEGPYVIPPEEFDTVGYETRFLTVYEDGVIDDDFGDVVHEDDVDDLIGVANLEHMGDYEDDLVHIRNDLMKVDFEVTRDYRRFSEIN